MGEVGEVVAAVEFKDRLRSELKGRRGRGASDEDITELLSSGVGGRKWIRTLEMATTGSVQRGTPSKPFTKEERWKRPNGSEHGGEGWEK